MKISVAHVPVDERARVWVGTADGLPYLHVEFANAADRNRDVQLVRHARGVHRLGVALAQLPEPMSRPFVVGDHCLPGWKTGNRLDELIGGIRYGRGLDEQVARVRVAEGRLTPDVIEDQAHAVVVEQLRRGDRRKAAAELRGQGCGVARILDGKQRDGSSRKRGDEPQAYPGDDRERALRPGQQRAERVPGVVLHEAG